MPCRCAGRPFARASTGRVGQQAVRLAWRAGPEAKPIRAVHARQDGPQAQGGSSASSPAQLVWQVPGLNMRRGGRRGRLRNAAGRCGAAPAVTAAHPAACARWLRAGDGDRGAGARVVAAGAVANVESDAAERRLGYATHGAADPERRAGGLPGHGPAARRRGRAGTRRRCDGWGPAHTQGGRRRPGPAFWGGWGSGSGCVGAWLEAWRWPCGREGSQNHHPKSREG